MTYMTSEAQPTEQLVDRLVPPRKRRMALPVTVLAIVVALVASIVVPNTGLVTPRLTLSASQLTTNSDGVVWRFEVINNGYSALAVSRIDLQAEGLSVDSVTALGRSVDGVVQQVTKNSLSQKAIIPPHTDYSFEAKISGIECGRIPMNAKTISVTAKTKFGPTLTRSYQAPESFHGPSAYAAGFNVPNHSWAVGVTQFYCEGK